NLYRLAGQDRQADWAHGQAAYLAELPPELLSVASMTAENRLGKAERLCRHFLRRNRHHPEAIRLLAQVADRLHVSADAELLLESCVELSPGFDRGLYDYVNFLLKMQKFEKAHRQARVLLARDPENLEYQSMLASATAGIGEHERAIEMFDRV